MRVVATYQHIFNRPGREGIVLEIDEVDLPLRVFGDLGAGLGAQPGMAYGDHPGVVISHPVHGPGPQAEHEPDHAPGGIDPVRPCIQVFGKGDAGQAREEKFFVWRPRNALDEDRHLFVAFAEPAGPAVSYGIRVQGAGIDEFHSPQKRLEPLFRRPLVRAILAAVLAGKGIPEVVLQQAGRAGDDRRLAEVGQHIPELFHDRRRKNPGEEAFFHLRKLLVRDGGGAGELEPQTEEVVVHQKREKNVRADIKGVVLLEDFGKVRLPLFRQQDSPGDEHARRLPTDPSGTDEAVPDAEKVVQRHASVHQAVEFGMVPDHHPGELLLEGGNFRHLFVERLARLLIPHEPAIHALPRRKRLGPPLQRVSARGCRHRGGIPAAEHRQPLSFGQRMRKEHLR